MHLYNFRRLLKLTEITLLKNKDLTQRQRVVVALSRLAILELQLFSVAKIV
jgi:hypothetical protein